MERYVIYTTQQCNCQCQYCYLDEKEATYTWEEIKELLDNIVMYNIEKEFSIEFLGGEPLLAFDLVEKAYNYLESIKTINVPSYVITTNGTILNEKIIKFLKNNIKVSFFASLDGTPFMNQFRTFKESGKNTYDIVMKNLTILKDTIGYERIGIHMVTHPYNIAFLSHGIDYLYDKGIRSFGIGTIEKRLIIDDEYCDRFIKELNIVSDYIIQGKYPNIYIDLLESIKPKTDEKHYIKNETGKIIAESYGRSQKDIIDSNVYNSFVGTSTVGDKIYNIRETVYMNHYNKIGGN